MNAKEKSSNFDVAKKIGYIIRLYRHLRNRSQLSLAEEAGLSLRNNQRIENGLVLCRIDTLIRISEILNVSLGSRIQDYPSKDLSIVDLSKSTAQSEKDILIGKF